MVEVRCENQAEIVDFVIARAFSVPVQASRFVGLGAYRGGRLIGGFVYTSHSPITPGVFSMEMHMAGSDGWMTRRTLRAFFSFPFIDRACSRVVGPVVRWNDRSAAICQRLGCRLDGVLRSGIGDEHDLMLWTMTRSECRWIN